MADPKTIYVKQLTSFYWENGITPEIPTMERLAKYAHFVAEKNNVLNLISRKDIDAIIENHIWISALISKYIPENHTRFLDIGTGGGFPGIPIAILRPLMRGVLVDSVRKKVEAVGEFVDKLMLTGIKAECSRVEDKGFIEKYQNSFDTIVSRATVPLIILVRYALPLIKNNAVLLSMKGGDLASELDETTLKYHRNIKKSTVYDLHYRPTNIKNIKEKKLVLLELVK